MKPHHSSSWQVPEGPPPSVAWMQRRRIRKLCPEILLWMDLHLVDSLLTTAWARTSILCSRRLGTGGLNLMRSETLPKAKASPDSRFTPALTGLLQCRCACAGSATETGGCESCEKSSLNLQRRFAHQGESSGVPMVVGEVLRLSGQPLDSSSARSGCMPMRS